MTYSIAQTFNYIANENAKGVFVKKEMVLAIIVNNKSKIRMQT